ncbi:hypothetical protein WR25_00847 [Diploscapter pachys]|uniref:NLE domain-containing protein n=1 Tax=Diploscapter pachys TaxID=2018661 RepID=A0A2A2JQZ1_9BILA|nr:hypothetical protein WR25_00847 [Diploscapter pachys]
MAVEDMEDEPSTTANYIQASFYTNEKDVVVPSNAYDIPTTATCENLNALVNGVIQAENEKWETKRFEFLIGETFVRSTLDDFIREFELDTETVVKIECVLGLEAPKPLHDLPTPDWVSSVHVIEDRIISTTYNGEIIFWNKKGEKEEILGDRDRGTTYKCSAILKQTKQLEGFEIIAGGDNQTLTLFRAEKGVLQPQTVFRGHNRSVECVAISDDAKRMASGAFDSFIKIWNLEESDQSTVFEKDSVNGGGDNSKAKKRKENFVTKVPMVTLSGHSDAVVSIQWCIWNPAHILSASWDNSIIEWDLELAGEISRIRGQRAFTSIDLNRKTGLVVASNTDAVPRLYDPRSKEGNLVKQSFIGHKGWVSQVRWNPNDERCFVSASFDKSLKMWDIRSSKTSLFDLHGHEDRVLCCAWGEDGRVASGSVDSTVKVYST